ncbi:MAG: DUF1080 domain-containing protein [Verrucomicrobia bacterium]|nr:DUF1080 domain-containing protein [Verrucomicrobiota bacterium]
MKSTETCLSAASLIIFAALTRAVVASEAPRGQRVSLFDGRTLAGWTVLKCEAIVQDGNLLLQAGNGLVQTERKYGDFVLELEWKPLKTEKWDSGIYFRYDTIPANRPWPLRYQVNLRQGEEGNLVGGPKGVQSKGLFRDREWNKLKLTVRGSRATLEVNGQPAWETDALEGPRESHLALQSEVPNGGQHLFRNLYVTELK